MSDTPGLIYAAIPKMLEEIGPIGKEKQCTAGARFNYRGIDDVYNAVNPVMAKHGVFVTTTVLDEQREERESKAGNATFYVRLKCKFTFFASDGSNVVSTIIGEAMDSGDKGTNKALSVAYKYALFQLLCIPTEAVDPDSEVHEVKAKPRPQYAPPPQQQQPPSDPYERAVHFIDASADLAGLLSLVTRCINHETLDAAQKLTLLERCARKAPTLKETHDGERATVLHQIVQGTEAVNV